VGKTDGSGDSDAGTVRPIGRQRIGHAFEVARGSRLAIQAHQPCDCAHAALLS